MHSFPTCGVSKESFPFKTDTVHIEQADFTHLLRVMKLDGSEKILFIIEDLKNRVANLL